MNENIIAGLPTELTTWAASITNALTAAGFKAEARLSGLDTIWPKGKLLITNPKLEGWTRFILLDIIHSKVTVIWRNREFRSSGSGSRRYSVLKGIEAKMVTLATEALKQSLAFEASQNLAQIEKNKWEDRRRAELNGLVLPPGMRAQIIGGTGPTSGFYSVGFSEHGNTVCQTPLTAVQVRALADLLNEFQQTNDKYILLATLPDGKLHFWKECDWVLVGSYSKPVGHTKAKIDEMLPRATAKCGHTATIKVVPYADLNTIGKPQDIDL
jgi:hypothetical protein